MASLFSNRSIGTHSETTKHRLLVQYAGEGNPQPTHCLFINEVPGSTKEAQEERFLYSFSH